MKEKQKAALFIAVADFKDGRRAAMEIRADDIFERATIKYSGAHSGLTWHPSETSKVEMDSMLSGYWNLKMDGAIWRLAEAGTWKYREDGGS